MVLVPGTVMHLTNLAYLRDQEARCRRIAGTCDRADLVEKMRSMADEYAERVAEILHVSSSSLPVMMQMPRHQGSPPVRKPSGLSK